MPVDLAAIDYDNSDARGVPVVILHGLFGSGRNWASIAQRLSSAHRVVALDARNHGASPWVDTMSYAEMGPRTWWRRSARVASPAPRCWATAWAGRPR